MRNLLIFVLLCSPFLVIGQQNADSGTSLTRISGREVEVVKKDNWTTVAFPDEKKFLDLVIEENRKWQMGEPEYYSSEVRLDNKSLLSSLSEAIPKRKRNLLANKKIPLRIIADPEGNILSVSYDVKNEILDVLSLKDLYSLRPFLLNTGLTKMN